MQCGENLTSYITFYPASLTKCHPSRDTRQVPVHKPRIKFTIIYRDPRADINCIHLNSRLPAVALHLYARLLLLQGARLIYY